MEWGGASLKAPAGDPNRPPLWDHLSKFIDITIPTLPILPLIGGDFDGIDPLGPLTVLSKIP